MLKRGNVGFRVVHRFQCTSVNFCTVGTRRTGDGNKFEFRITLPFCGGGERGCVPHMGFSGGVKVVCGTKGRQGCCGRCGTRADSGVVRDGDFGPCFVGSRLLGFWFCQSRGGRVFG